MADHFLYKGPHWGNVNDLETIEIKLAWIFVLPSGELVKNSEHGVVVKLKLFVRHEMPPWLNVIQDTLGQSSQEPVLRSWSTSILAVHPLYRQRARTKPIQLLFCAWQPQR